MSGRKKFSKVLITVLLSSIIMILASSAAMAGFVRKDGRRYFYRYGNQVTGWLKRGKRTYYLDPEQGGAAAVGYTKIGEKAYFFRKNGVMLKKSFIRSGEGNYYYALKGGRLARGLRKIKGRYYYFDWGTNVMKTGWVKTARYTYYMKAAGSQKGSAVTGWMRKQKKTYHFDWKGRMTTGFADIDGSKYYFDEKTGALVKGTVRAGGKTYRTDNTGVISSVKAPEPTGPWNIKVNQNTCAVTVYRGTVPVKAFACSVGVNGRTPNGTFYIRDKLRWHELMGPSWGQWCEHITGDILFHSIPYNSYCDKYSMSSHGYNMLGQPASHGCIRLAASSAKYIYDNVPVGSKVVIFRGSSGDDPLGKPMTPYVGWWGHTYDPTDPTV